MIQKIKIGLWVRKSRRERKRSRRRTESPSCIRTGIGLEKRICLFHVISVRCPSCMDAVCTRHIKDVTNLQLKISQSSQYLWSPCTELCSCIEMQTGCLCANLSRSSRKPRDCSTWMDYSLDQLHLNSNIFGLLSGSTLPDFTYVWSDYSDLLHLNSNM